MKAFFVKFKKLKKSKKVEIRLSKPSGLALTLVLLLLGRYTTPSLVKEDLSRFFSSIENITITLRLDRQDTKSGTKQDGQTDPGDITKPDMKQDGQTDSVDISPPNKIPEKEIPYNYNKYEIGNLILNLNNLKDKNDSIEALLYNELAARLKNFALDQSKDYLRKPLEELANATGFSDKLFVPNGSNRLTPEFSEHIGRESVYAWAKATDFSDEPLASNNGISLTPEFVEYIQQYQSSNGLKITGDLDYKTRATTAERDINIFLYNIFPDPSSVPTRDNLGQCPRLTSVDIGTAWQELPRVAQLVSEAEKSEQAKDYATAVWLFNEAHAVIETDRSRTNDKHAIENYKMMNIYTGLRIYENAGYALNISDPVICDPVQQRYVMTSTMVEEVKRFQKETGISPTGMLDYPTIQNMIIHLDSPSPPEGR